MKAFNRSIIFSNEFHLNGRRVSVEVRDYDGDGRMSSEGDAIVYTWMDTWATTAYACAPDGKWDREVGEMETHRFEPILREDDRLIRKASQFYRGALRALGFLER